MRDYHSTPKRTLGRRAQRTSRARSAGGNAPRGPDLLRQTVGRHARGQSSPRLSRRPRLGSRCYLALWHRLCAEWRRCASSPPESEISRKAARGIRSLFARPGRKTLRPFPPPHHVSHCKRVGQDRGLRLPRSDRKSTRLNSSHVSISYAVFCLKKKKTLMTSSWGVSAEYSPARSSLSSA